MTNVSESDCHPTVLADLADLRSDKIDRRTFLVRATALGLSAASACALAGVSTQAAKADENLPKPGGTLRISMPVMPIVDPRLFDWPEMGNLARTFLEPLVRFTRQFTLEPHLLDRWEVDPTATQYTLHLRPGATWSNGDPFVAEDVIFNLGRWCEAHIPGNSMAQRMQSLVEQVSVADDGAPVFGPRPGALERLDDHTVRVTLNKPDVTFIPNLSDYPALIVHRDFDTTGGNLLSQPLGTGPWVLEQMEPGQFFRAVRRPDAGGWWGDTVSGPVYLDAVEYHDLGTNPRDELQAFTGGRIDANFETPAGFAQAFAEAGLQRSDVLSGATICVRMNTRQPPFDDVRVRRALQSAVDNETILDLGYDGMGLRAENHHVGPMNPDYAPLPPQIADPSGAFEALNAAGHGDTEFDLVSIDDDWRRNTCDAVAAQLRDAGIKVRRTILGADAFWSDWKAFPFSGTNWTMRPLAVQTYMLGYRSGATWNETGFSDTRFDTLLDEAMGLSDIARRIDVMAEMEQILQSSGVIIQPYWRSLCRDMRTQVRGLEIHPTFEDHLERVWIDE
ncbi:MAG: ABC transporter substrate-binding protein [Pseudomonadota bacterium]